MASKPLPISFRDTGVVLARRRAGAVDVSTGTACVVGARAPRASKMLTRGIVVPTPTGRTLSVIGSPVCRSTSRINPTPAVGAAWRRIAHVPVTCGVAIDVPLYAWKSPPGTDEVIEPPGANSDMNGATFEKEDTWFCLSVDPTLTAVEMQAGAERPVPDPLLPAAITVATPIARRLSITGLYGWLLQVDAKVDGLPRLMLTAATLRDAARPYTYSSPARMSDEKAPTQCPLGQTPVSVMIANTCTATTFAAFATPENDCPA